MSLNVNQRNINMDIAFFILLLPYLQGSIGLVTGRLLYYALPIIAVILIYLQNPRKIKFYIKELYIWMFILLPYIIRNYDVKIGRYNNIINFIVIVLIYYILNQKTDWMNNFWYIVRLFCFVHFALGIFFLFNKNLLYSWVIPRFTMTENTYSLLNKAINNGYMTGICNHYSKMGMYMALGTVAFALPIFKQRERKTKDFLIFCAFVIGLAMTGKRGPLLFSILALLIVFFEYSEKKLTKRMILKFFGGLSFFIALSTFAYFKIPQIQSVIARFFEASNMKEMTNGRIDFFWVQAIEMFKKHPILGYGWGAFKAYSKNGNDAHNIYLQLLVETGLIGFGMVIIFFVCSILAIKKSICITKEIDDTLCANLKVAYAFQLFFLMYGFTGNPLYDGQCYIPYLVSCAMGWKIYFSNLHQLRR